MSEPEIARRCLSCGASVRGRASFCPQCGNPMEAAAVENRSAATAAGTKDEPRPPVRSPLVEEAARVAATLNEKLPPRAPETSAPGGHPAASESKREPRRSEDAARAGAQATQTFGQAESGADQGARRAGTAPAQQQAGVRGRVGRRAATVGASVGENLRPRVDKLREASTVVFDEATDDPGLRFVIIAAVLFLVFVFIFLFSYILG